MVELGEVVGFGVTSLNHKTSLLIEMESFQHIVLNSLSSDLHCKAFQSYYKSPDSKQGFLPYKPVYFSPSLLQVMSL